MKPHLNSFLSMCWPHLRPRLECLVYRLSPRTSVFNLSTHTTRIVNYTMDAAVNELWRSVTLNGAAQRLLLGRRHAYERYYHVYAW